MRLTILVSGCVGLLLLVTGCGKDDAAPSADTQNDAAAVSADGAKYLLSAEPEGAGNVIQVRSEAVEGEEVLVVGRIGGSANPWIDGRAAFTIVDESLKACSDIEGDQCPKPWDYCCEVSKLPTATALVKVVDENGELVRADAKGLLNVRELSTVVVQGRAARDEAGNLTVLARGVFVKSAAAL